jgi:hypothetical protein
MATITTSFVLFCWLLLAAAVAAFASSSLSDKSHTPEMKEDETTSILPQLPAVDPDDARVIPSLQFGETLRFEEMGPIIINADGTTRRINNWDQMTEKEKEATWRRISQRNEQRRKLLLQKQQEEEGEAKKEEQ